MHMYNQGEYVSRVQSLYWCPVVYEEAASLEVFAYLVRRTDDRWVVRIKLLKSDGRGLPFDPNDRVEKDEIPVGSEADGIACLGALSKRLVADLGKPNKVKSLAPKTNKWNVVVMQMAKAGMVSLKRIDRKTGEEVVLQGVEILRELEVN